MMRGGQRPMDWRLLALSICSMSFRRSRREGKGGKECQLQRPRIEKEHLSSSSREEYLTSLPSRGYQEQYYRAHQIKTSKRSQRRFPEQAKETKGRKGSSSHSLLLRLALVHRKSHSLLHQRGITLPHNGFQHPRLHQILPSAGCDLLSYSVKL